MRASQLEFVSLFPDVLCNNGLSVTGWRNNAFQQLYTPSSFHNKSVHKRKLIASMSARFEWEFPTNPYVSLFPDVLCNKGLSVTDWRKIHFNGYTLHQLSTINQFTRETRIRTIRVDNFRLE